MKKRTVSTKMDDPARSARGREQKKYDTNKNGSRWIGSHSAHSHCRYRTPPKSVPGVNETPRSTSAKSAWRRVKKLSFVATPDRYSTENRTRPPADSDPRPYRIAADSRRDRPDADVSIRAHYSRDVAQAVHCRGPRQAGRCIGSSRIVSDE